MDERVRFLAACSESDDSFAGICRAFGISRKAGYKWLTRYEQAGPRGLEELRSGPRHSPQRTPDGVLDVLLAARKEHPT